MAGMTWITRTIRWHRRSIAAILVALGTLALVAQFSGTTEETAHVVVTISTVAAGSPITAADVALQSMPRAGIPADAVTEMPEAVGRQAAVTLTPHTIMQPALMVAGSPVPEGRALVPITVKDAQLLELLSPGLRIALVSAGAEVPGIVTDDAVVHSMPQAVVSTFASTNQSTLVLVDVPSALAPKVSVLGQSGQLSIFLTGTS